jgi:ribonuclease BN (tRNA processing enzyme)
MKTTLTFLGAGSAFSFANGQNNLMIDIEDNSIKGYHRMLVDCGTQIQYMSLGQMYKEKVQSLLDSKKAKTYREAVALINLDISNGKIPENEPMMKFIEFISTIDSIFITHNHADHNSLECIGFLTRFIPTLKKLKLYGMGKCLTELWDNSLSAGMASLNYGQMTEEERHGRITLESYFEPIYLTGDPEDAIRIGSNIIEPFTTMHVSNRMKQVDSCGLLIKTFSGKEIMFTSDTQYCPKQLEDMYEAVDIIIHDCETGFPSSVHAHINDLKTLPQHVKDKMILCHYNDGFDRTLTKEYGFKQNMEMGDTLTII